MPVVVTYEYRLRDTVAAGIFEEFDLLELKSSRYKNSKTLKVRKDKIGLALNYVKKVKTYHGPLILSVGYTLCRQVDGF